MRKLFFPVFLTFFVVAELLFVSTVSAKMPPFSPENFRTSYNEAAKSLDAPIMPEKYKKELQIQEKDNPQKILSLVDIYSLNSRTTLLLNTSKDQQKVVLGAAIVAGSGEYSLDESTDIQKAMQALITVMTSEMSPEERKKLELDLGLEEGESGDFTDGKIRSKVVDNVLFYTTANESTGLELIIRQAKK